MQRKISALFRNFNKYSPSTTPTDKCSKIRACRSWHETCSCKSPSKWHSAGVDSPSPTEGPPACCLPLLTTNSLDKEIILKTVLWR